MMTWDDVRKRLVDGAYGEIVERALLGRRPWIFGTDAEFEEWKTTIDDLVGAAKAEIRIVGSAATGFTLSPEKPVGRPFRVLSGPADQASDIDVAVVASGIFVHGWNAILEHERTVGFGRSEAAERMRVSIYNGFMALRSVPKESKVAKWLLSVQGALSRTPPLRGYSVQFRVYRRVEDLRAYHIWSLSRLHARLVELANEK